MKNKIYIFSYIAISIGIFFIIIFSYVLIFSYIQYKIHNSSENIEETDNSIEIDIEETVEIVNLTEEELIIQEYYNELDYKIKSDMTDYEKLLVIHDYILDTIEFDNSGNESLITSEQVILNKKGLCLGYSELFMDLAAEHGIECHVIVGNDVNHIWNAVNIDGEYYYIDTLWDDLQSNYRHYYFVRNTEEFENPEKGDSHFNPNPIFECNSEKYCNNWVHDCVGSIEYHEGEWIFTKYEVKYITDIDGIHMRKYIE